MSWKYLRRTVGIGALALVVSACAWLAGQSGSPALQPFLAAAPETEAVSLQEPLTVGLVWVKPSEASVTIPERAERATLDTMRSHFAEEGKRLTVVRTDTVTSVDLSALRQLGQTHGLTHFLIVAPTVQEVQVPTRLPYGRGGYEPGTRTESYILLEAVGVKLATGASLFAARGNAAAALEELDYGPLGPWYPRISRGVDRAGFGGFIYPDAEEFPPGEVRAVALKDAVAGLLAELDRLGSPKTS